MTESPSGSPARSALLVHGAILAGGAARRYGGRAKGLEAVGGRRILDRLVEALYAATGELPLLVANAPEARTWRPDLRVVSDRRPGAGSLGGLYTAVLDAPAPVVCVAWDMPFVSPALLQRLAAGLQSCDVYLPESGGRRGVEPLCGAYGPACAAAMAQELDRGAFQAVSFHGAVRAGILSLDQVRRFGDPDRLFFNVNTADDLARANAMA